MTNTIQQVISPPITTAYLPHTDHRTLQRTSQATITAGATFLRIFLEIGGDNGATACFDVTSILTIGRLDPTDTHVPDLDLTRYGGWDSGVSRHHAKISIMDKGLYITDRGSTNGTRVNGFNVTANLPYQLHEGDTIEVGRIKMTLRKIQDLG